MLRSAPRLLDSAPVDGLGHQNRHPFSLGVSLSPSERMALRPCSFSQAKCLLLSLSCPQCGRRHLERQHPQRSALHLKGTHMMTHALIVFGVAAIGLSFATGSPWKGLLATIWVFGAIAFWGGLYVALTA